MFFLYFSLIKQINGSFSTNYNTKDPNVASFDGKGGTTVDYYVPSRNSNTVSQGINHGTGGLESMGFLKRYNESSDGYKGSSGNNAIMEYGENVAIPMLNSWFKDVQGYEAGSTGQKIGFKAEHVGTHVGYWTTLWFYDAKGVKHNVAELADDLDLLILNTEKVSGHTQIELDYDEGEDAYKAGLDMNTLIRAAINRWGNVNGYILD